MGLNVLLTYFSYGQLLDISKFLMSNTYTAIFEHEDRWYISYCPEIPGANGQGLTKEEARQSLASAIELILHDRREDMLRELQNDAEQDTVIVG